MGTSVGVQALACRVQPKGWTPTFLAMTVVVACIGRLSAAEPSSDKPPDDKPAAATADELAWPTGLEAAKRRARTENRPLLVRAGATWCGPCRELDKEIAKADVQSELALVARVSRCG